MLQLKQKSLGIFFVVFFLLLFIFSSPANAQGDSYRKDCWTKSDCMTRVNNCDPCFELKEETCGANRGFCYAKPEPVALSISLGGLSEVHDPAQYISTLYQWGVSITGILAGIMIMVGGLLYLTAGGSPERVNAAKSYIGNALIGMVLAMTSYFLLQTINPDLLGLKFPKIPLPRTIFPNTFCEDLIENPEIQVDPVTPGKTSCGDLGLPKLVAGATETTAENLPTECVYGYCNSEEEACILCTDQICPSAANCFACAGTRLDPALQKIKTGGGKFLGDVLQERQDLGKNVCEKLEIRAKDSKQYSCQLADSPNILSDSALIDSLVDFADKMAFAELMVSGKFTTAFFTETAVQGGAAIEARGVEAGTTIRQGGQAVRGGVAAYAVIRSAIRGTGVLNLIAASTIAAFREFATVVFAPERIIGEKATCALVTIDCKEIDSCEDYGNKVIWKGSNNTSLTLQQITAPYEQQKAWLMDHPMIFWTKYCTSNPCQLPTKCAPSTQEYFYWSPNRWGGPIEDNPEIIDFWGSAHSKKCVPVEMVSPWMGVPTVAAIRDSASGYMTWTENIDDSFVTGKTLWKKNGVPRDKIYPIVYPFNFLYPGKKQGEGMLCKNDADCADRLSCTASGVTYENVKEATESERNPIQISKNQEPTSVTYKRCQ